MAMKFRSNDKVIILSGKNKGQQGVIKNIISSQKVIINGVNIVKKHQKPNQSQNQNGGIINKEAPIQISNIAILNPESLKADRVGFRIENGKKVRFFKSNKKIIT